MDVVQVTLMCRFYAEQCPSRARMLDLAGDLSQVVALSCATHFMCTIVLISSIAVTIEATEVAADRAD